MDLLGSTLNQRFRLDQEIGRGGFGVVYRASDLQLGREVAVKILFSQLASTDSVQRFLREAQVSSQLQDPHIITTFDFGVYEGGVIYIVTELLKGLSLSGLHSKTALSLAQICNLMAQISQGLLTAHQAGVIHRDIKPANLFVEWRNKPVVKVIDFGIAKALQTSQEAANQSEDGIQTQTKALFGTPHYMSPEQVRSTKNVSYASDVYSLGVVLYELVMGHLPFESDEPIQIMIKHLQEPLPNISATPIPRHNSVSIEHWQAVVSLITKMMDKDEVTRLTDFQHITEAFNDLHHDIKRATPSEYSQELSHIQTLIESRAVTYAKNQSGVSLPKLDTASGLILNKLTSQGSPRPNSQPIALGDTLDSADSLRTPELESAQNQPPQAIMDATVDWDESTYQSISSINQTPPPPKEHSKAPESTYNKLVQPVLSPQHSSPTQLAPATPDTSIPITDSTLGTVKPAFDPHKELPATQLSISMSKETLTPKPLDEQNHPQYVASGLQADFAPNKGFAVPQAVPKSAPYPTLFPEGFDDDEDPASELYTSTTSKSKGSFTNILIGAGLVIIAGLWFVVSQFSSEPNPTSNMITATSQSQPGTQDSSLLTKNNAEKTSQETPIKPTTSHTTPLAATPTALNPTPSTPVQKTEVTKPKPVAPIPHKVRLYFKSRPSFTVGESIRVSAKVWSQTGEKLKSKVTYKVSPNIARVKRGKLYFKKPGEAKVKACVKTKDKILCSPRKGIYVIDPF